ncbi:GABA/polyamine transporter [Saitoella coloradoensis]
MNDIGWWAVSARKWFRGPKVNVEHMMLDRLEAMRGRRFLGSGEMKEDVQKV